MPLPAANGLVLAPQFYPDRIVLSVRIALSNEAAYQTVRSIQGNRWRSNRLRAAQSLRRLDVSLSAKQLDDPGHVAITVNFNPLVQRHRDALRDRQIAEYSPDGSQNWLPSATVVRDNRGFWDFVGETLWGIGADIVTLCDDLLAPTYVGPGPSLLGVSLFEVEAAFDFASRLPRAFVHSRYAHFAGHFTDARYSQYTRPGLIAEDAGRLVHAITARPYSGEKVKLYSKTNRRVRFELSASKAALRRIGVAQRTIDGPDAFARIFDRVAHRAAAVANVVLALDGPHPAHEQEGLIELLVSLTRRVRSAEKIFAFIDAIAAGGRVSASWDRHVPGRLVADGILERRGRGVYGLSAQYHRAGELLVDLYRRDRPEIEARPFIRHRSRSPTGRTR